MTAYEIPLSPEPQEFDVALGATVYRLRVSWCEAAGSWTLDISDSDRQLVAAGIALVAGRNLIAPFRSLGLEGELRVQSDSDRHASPSKTDLGITSHLYYIV